MVVQELSGENRAVSRQLPFARLALNEDAEMIAGLQIGIEIDLTRKHLRHAERELDAFTGLVNRRGQRVGLAIDVTLDGDDGGLFRNALDGGDETRRAIKRRAFNDEALVAVDLVLESPHAAIEQPVKRVRLPRAQLSDIHRRGDRRNEYRRIGALDHVVFEQVANRGARRDESGQEV